MTVYEQIKQYHTQYVSELAALTEELRSQPMPELTEALFAEFENCGNRIRYEKVYFGRRKFLSVFGLAAVIWKKEDDIKKLEDVILGICEEECWALPAHVDRKKNPDWRNTIDLFASETAQSLVHICELLRDRLSESVKQRARDEAMRRVLCPFLASEVPYAEWETAKNNWNAVCCGNIGSLGLLLLPEGEEKRHLLERIRYALETHYLGSFGMDGVCQEGLGYWVYGFTYYMLFADALKSYNPSMDMIRSEKAEAIAHFQERCYFYGGRTVSFSDGDSEGRYPVGLTCCLSLQYPDIRFPDIMYALGLQEDHCWRWIGIYWNWFWSGKMLHAIEGKQMESPLGLSEEGIDFMQEAEWAILRGAHHSAAAVKGGNNGESHNHNDVGSFCYLAEGEAFLEDLGAGEYTKDYFSAKRYTIFCNSGESHNIPIISGTAQLEGEQYHAELFERNEDQIEIAFAQAYPEPLLRKLRRSVKLDSTSGELIVRDVITAEKEISVQENLITRLPVEVEKDKVIVKGIKHDAILTVNGAEGGPELTEAVHSNHNGEPELIHVMRWRLKYASEGEYCAEIRLQLLDKE